VYRILEHEETTTLWVLHGYPKSGLPPSDFLATNYDVYLLLRLLVISQGIIGVLVVSAGYVLAYGVISAVTIVMAGLILICLL